MRLPLRSRISRAIAPTAVLAGLLLALVPALALADGEAGLIIQNGDEIETYCVPFEGDSIAGDELLRVTGHTVVQFGGAARTTCAIDDVGCFNPSSFDSCFCECRTGGDCVYWAFFTKKYGTDNFVYSTTAVNTTKARDGDIFAHRWGAGGPQSAPPPDDMTFEEICGHAPRGGGGAPLVTLTPAAGAENPARGDDGGTHVAPLLGFGTVAVVLAGLIAVAVWRRRTHGA